MYQLVNWRKNLLSKFVGELYQNKSHTPVNYSRQKINLSRADLVGVDLNNEDFYDANLIKPAQ